MGCRLLGHYLYLLLCILLQARILKSAALSVEERTTKHIRKQPRTSFLAKGCKMICISRTLYLIFTLITVSIYGGIPTLESLTTDISTNTFSSYVSKGLIMNAHSKDSFEYTMAFKQVSSGLHLTVLTPSSESSLNLTPSFKVTQSSFKVSSQNLSEKINYDHRIGKRNDLNEVVFSYYLKKEEVRKKGVYYTNNTIDTFSIIPVLQAISKHSPEAFSADFAVQHMALKVPVVIQKVISNNLLPFFDGYTLPPQLEAHIRSTKKPYIVYVLSVTGWQGFIYNHRHYYVFSNDSPYNYVGHWGGQDKTNLFSWAVNR